jgi:hypothetical protein
MLFLCVQTKKLMSMQVTLIDEEARKKAPDKRVAIHQHCAVLRGLCMVL